MNASVCISNDPKHPMLLRLDMGRSLRLLQAPTRTNE